MARIKRNNLLVGLVAIFIGTVFLLDNLNIMPHIFDIGRLWPVFIIIGGLFVMFAEDEK